MLATVPSLRPANITAARGLTPAALSKYTRNIFCGRNSPGEEMYNTTPTTRPRVKMTKSPVRTSFRRICMRWCLHYRPYRRPGNKLVNNRILRGAKSIGGSVLDNLSLVKHRHPCSNPKCTFHLVCDNDRCCIRFLRHT